MRDFDTFTKIAQNMDDLGLIIFATGFEKFRQDELKNRLICNIFFISGVAVAVSSMTPASLNPSAVKNERN